MNITFKPSDKLTFQTVQADRGRLVRQLNDSVMTTLFFDLSQVDLCDSAGLALLIETKRLCKQHNKKLVIEGMPQSVHALAEFCGLETILNE